LALGGLHSRACVASRAALGAIRLSNSRAVSRAA